MAHELSHVIASEAKQSRAVGREPLILDCRGATRLAMTQSEMGKIIGSEV